MDKPKKKDIKKNIRDTFVIDSKERYNAFNLGYNYSHDEWERWFEWYKNRTPEDIINEEDKA
ncbi:MAG TPA: hypothetical protein ENH82_17220 [bacterium]|nr:hypothetical protein [bacterium]